MKRLLLLVLVVCPLLTFPQTPNAREMMGKAMQELGTIQDLRLVLQGVEKTGNLQSQFSVNVFVKQWLDGIRRMSQLEMVIAKDNLLQQRIAADGTLLWLWKPQKKEYGCLNYGNFEGGQPELYTSTLCRLLEVEARGPAALAGRLIAYAFGQSESGVQRPLNQLWSPWPAMADVSIEGNEVVCSTEDPAMTEVRYLLEPYGTDGYKLMGIDFVEKVMVGAKTRVTSWHMDVVRLSSPIPAEVFKFVPPAGARSVSLPVRTGG